MDAITMVGIVPMLSTTGAGWRISNLSQVQYGRQPTARAVGGNGFT